MSQPSKQNSFFAAPIDRDFRPTAICVALIVETILFSINHGTALVKRKMTVDRWISGVLTYLVPYAVNIHGQYTSRQRSI
ncbi:MAG: nitrate/nitrite transporter NrtS [Cyanobacteria bacterium SID2]|nr:nitrate/nitrite transporter NrtS [Cyanobacteria bacterium SID2]MBP0006493.1 nitrate/nitrite transporter NrtS [Cyanobacteria bacterium SBC]